jgi:endonuclease YncB( thermonuclease family)
MRMILRGITLTALTLLVMFYVARNADDTRPLRNSCTVGTVLSGNSLTLKCKGAPETRVQLAGVDAPNVEAPGCAEELAHGTLATERLQSLIGSGQVRIERIAGGNSPPLIRIRIAGEDVAARLVREGLAVASVGGARINWCQKLVAE